MSQSLLLAWLVVAVSCSETDIAFYPSASYDEIELLSPGLGAQWRRHFYDTATGVTLESQRVRLYHPERKDEMVAVDNVDVIVGLWGDRATTISVVPNKSQTIASTRRQAIQLSAAFVNAGFKCEDFDGADSPSATAFSQRLIVDDPCKDEQRIAVARRKCELVGNPLDIVADINLACLIPGKAEVKFRYSLSYRGNSEFATEEYRRRHGL